MENALNVVNRQILEIKKKIQLSEGQRKAHHEECDAERKKNAERIQQLKAEIKELRKKLAQKPEKYGDVLVKIKGQNAMCKSHVSKVTAQEAVSILDQQVMENKKKLDLLYHQTHKGRERMRSLAEQYQELLVQHVVSQQKTKSGSPESYELLPKKEERKKSRLSYIKQHIRSLENQLHRNEMSVAEACHVRQKYRSIRAGLLEDSANYESTLMRLEETLLKQEEEICKLQVVCKEALSLRDATKGSLVKQEEIALSVGKEREQKLQECRRKVEEREKALLALENKMFPTSSHRTGTTGSPPSSKTHSPRYGKSPSAHRLFGSGGGDEKSPNFGVYQSSTEEEDENAHTVAVLEAAFAKLKEATGETNTEDVLKRFQKQRETQSRLTYLRKVAEEEKAKLTAKRESLQAELHTSQFAQVCSKEQNLEEIERIKNLILEEKDRKEKTEQKVNALLKDIGKIKRKLYNYCKSLQLADQELIPAFSKDAAFALVLLSFLKEKFQKIVEQSKGELNGQKFIQNGATPPAIKKQTEDMFGNTGMFTIERRHGNAAAPEVEIELEDDGVGHGKGGPSGAEEIPTRAFLKRQAQLIVDAKARRRFFVVRGPVGAATIGPKIRRDK